MKPNELHFQLSSYLPLSIKTKSKQKIISTVVRAFPKISSFFFSYAYFFLIYMEKRNCYIHCLDFGVLGSVLAVLCPTVM